MTIITYRNEYHGVESYDMPLTVQDPNKSWNMQNKISGRTAEPGEGAASTSMRPKFLSVPMYGPPSLE
jgi:hypothetical protein